MTARISMDSALKLLTLIRSQRNTPEERKRINQAIYDLTRAKEDPQYYHWLHLPVATRGEYADD